MVHMASSVMGSIVASAVLQPWPQLSHKCHNLKVEIQFAEELIRNPLSLRISAKNTILQSNGFSATIDFQQNKSPNPLKNTKS